MKDQLRAMSISNEAELVAHIKDYSSQIDQ